MLTLDGDGSNEVVVAYSDRLVRCFRWQESSLDSSSSDLQSSDVTATDDLDRIRAGGFVLVATWNLAGQVRRH